MAVNFRNSSRNTNSLLGDLPIPYNKDLHSSLNFRKSAFNTTSMFDDYPMPDYNILTPKHLIPDGSIGTSFEDSLFTDPILKANLKQFDSQVSGVPSPLKPSWLSGNGISAPIDPDVDILKDQEVESIQNQWKSFLAEYERIYDEANDAQRANWQAAADWNERMYRDQWKMQAEGLREAGINPLMMAGALRASSVPQMSAASVVAPSFPSNEFSATADTEIAGLYSLYATLSTLQSEERRAELARILGYAELSQKAADSILRFIGSFFS